jgi:hypothetical protein
MTMTPHCHSQPLLNACFQDPLVHVMAFSHSWLSHLCLPENYAAGLTAGVPLNSPNSYVPVHLEALSIEDQPGHKSASS